MLHAFESGTGTPVMWIHGFPLCSEIFANQLSIPVGRHLFVDLPGCGHSAVPQELRSINHYARSILDVLDDRKIDSAVFAGLSMGGYICFEIARIAQKRVKGLILIDTRETADTPEQKKGRYESIEKVKAKGPSVVIDAMLPKMLTKSAFPSTISGVRRIMASNTPEGIVAALQAMAERSDSSDLLPKLKVPALVVVGEDDTITPPADAERMARALPDAKLVKMRGAAHLPNVERPAEFNAIVTQFLTSHWR